MTRSLAVLVLLPAVALTAPVPKEGKDESRLYLTIGGKIVSMNPDGTDEKTVCEKGDGNDDRLSPDGKWIVWVKRDNKKDKYFVMLREPGGQGKVTAEVSHMAQVRWSADGKLLRGVDQHLRPGGKGGLVEAGPRHWQFDVVTETFTEVDPPNWPKGFAEWGETRDGKELILEQTTGEQQFGTKFVVHMPKLATVLTPRDKFEPKVVISDEVNVSPISLFPDGKRWLVTQITPYKRDLGVYTLGEKKPAWWGMEECIGSCTLSPNGRRVAYVTDEPFPKDGKRTADSTKLWVANADGKNAKKVMTTEKDITRIDWR